MRLTKQQLDALDNVYHQIAADIPAGFSPTEIAELIIDASRLEIHGYPEIQKQISAMAQKDYGETLRAIAEELYL
jgi:hypothetical protein